MQDRLSRWEQALWMLLAAASVAMSLARNHGPIYANDSFQYLSVAEHWRTGQGLATSIIHFDSEFSRRDMPASVTTFPPGYPIATTVVSMVGVSLPAAATAVSALSFVLCIPLVVACCGLLPIPRNAVRLVCVLLITNHSATSFPIRLLAEQLFGLLTLAGVYLLMRVDAPASGSVAWRPHVLAAAGVVVGLCYWVRYAGLFLLVAAISFYAIRWLRQRSRRAFASLLLVGLAIPIVGAGLIRNVMLSGTWKGGNEKEAANSIAQVLKTLVTSVYHLFFGSAEVTRLRPPQLLLLLSLVAFAIVAVRVFRSDISAGNTARHTRSSLIAPAAVFPTYFVVVYTAAMIYAGVVTVISFGLRMFYPLLPLLLVLGAFAVTRVGDLASATRSSRLIFRGAAVFLCVGWLWANARNIAVATVVPSPQQQIAARFDPPRPGGQSLSAWFEENLPPDAVLAATDGQRTGWVLSRPTLSLVEAEYSDRKWTEETLKTAMQRYGASYLILYPTAPADLVPVQKESAFVGKLLERRFPPWLELAASNANALIYRVTADGR
ncbi:MAG: hypothetical protein MJE77_40560 [Proteobacteria bacterium]|nr:hypothetical protein [Pseudomonadota bacterium]